MCGELFKVFCLWIGARRCPLLASSLEWDSAASSSLQAPHVLLMCSGEAVNVNGLSCFFDDPRDVGNLISGSSVFSKSTLNIWKFLVHILLKPRLENFEHYFASV